MAAYSAFCMNDRFDCLSSRTVLEGREARRYRLFDDAPVEGKFDWGGFFQNLAVGILVAAGETIYMAHKEFPSGNVRDTHEMGRNWMVLVGVVQDMDIQ